MLMIYVNDFDVMNVIEVIYECHNIGLEKCLLWIL